MDEEDARKGEQTNPVSGLETDLNADVDDVDINTNVDADADTDVDAETEVDMNASVDADVDADDDGDGETEVDLNPDGSTDVDAEVDADVEMEADVQGEELGESTEFPDESTDGPDEPNHKSSTAGLALSVSEEEVNEEAVDYGEGEDEEEERELKGGEKGEEVGERERTRETEGEKESRVIDLEATPDDDELTVEEDFGDRTKSSVREEKPNRTDSVPDRPAEASENPERGEGGEGEKEREGREKGGSEKRGEREGEKLSEEELVSLMGPAHGCEVFVGGITRDMTEDDLREHFSPVGKIYEVRMQRDKESGVNKGFAFVTFYRKEDAEKAMDSLNESELKNRRLKVTVSLSKHRLFVGNVPRAWSNEEFERVVEKEGRGITSVELLMDPKFPARNRGFAFVEYHNHNCAEQARRAMSRPSFRLGVNLPTINWAEAKETREETPVDPTFMANVKVIYVRGFPDGTTEETLRELFGKYGTITRVLFPSNRPSQPKRDFAFIHFNERSEASSAVEDSGKVVLDGRGLEVSFARPPPEKARLGFPPSSSSPFLSPLPSSSAYPSSSSYASPSNQSPYYSPNTGSRGSGNPSRSSYYSDYYGGSERERERGYGREEGGYGGRGGDYRGGDVPIIYGRGPIPPSCGVAPMILPDGRVGYVLQPADCIIEPGAYGAFSIPSPISSRAALGSDRGGGPYGSSGGGAAYPARPVDTAPYYSRSGGSSNRDSRYRPY